ncbi:hypothetical protein B0H63DRAFT_521292 [Podospora didyma]|uniref:Glucan 1, 4-alpha-glucosidase n=1 Tax=Podospora didyma TaxID=330526 RepID=A0AAE0NT59_9PEZI|nr:hypothetical protein B0H63DRAFT_521292 [Podospora didyma]
MSSTSPQSPPRRPRLSLQIKALAHGASVQTSRNLAAAVDVTSPTAFNTLSNVYATTVDRSTPIQEKPPTNALTGGKPVLRLQTQDGASAKDRRLHTPYLGPLLDTPLSAQPSSPATGKEVCFPSSMTATPPMSAQAQEQNSQVFTFDGSSTTPVTARISYGGQTPTSHTPRRRTTMPANPMNLPYTHPRSLRSILRNSPLPPLSTKSPVSPRRQSLRLQEKALRRVAYNSPLCETISTSLYTKSHVDLLSEDATPTTPSMASDDDVLDQTMAYTGNETRDGGQTPGPFEEMRRRMTTLSTSTPVTATPLSGGIRKRSKKREKKRRWVWTIGQESEEGEETGDITSSVGNSTPASSKKEVLAVPLIAVPSPKTRTRMARSGASLEIPVIATNIPPAARAAPYKHVLTPAPAPSPRATPEPFTAVVEPPTPSVDSMASQSSLFERESFGDVEMSDASSVMSDYEDIKTATQASVLGIDMDIDMGMGGATPTLTARPGMYTAEENRSWAPWAFSMQQPDRAETCS